MRIKAPPDSAPRESCMKPSNPIIWPDSGLLLLAIFLWWWFSMPLPQMIALYHVRHHFRFVDISFYPGTITYYEHLIWGALLGSFVGPVLIWSITRRFARVPPV